MSTKFISPKVKYVENVNGYQIMQKLERCARTCYQSDNGQHTKSTADFLRGIIKSGHTSVLEHSSITLDIITDRGVLAEWTRHRIGVGYSVESTRYVNYSNGVEFVVPVEYDHPTDQAKARVKIFTEACDTAAYAYHQLIKNGAKPQEARAVLPQALKVNMKVTMNIRAWRHFFELRCAPSAHPNMREIAIAILLEFRKKMNPLFEDIKYDEAFYQEHKKRINEIFEQPEVKIKDSDSINIGVKKALNEELIRKHEQGHEEMQQQIKAARDIYEWMKQYRDDQEKKRVDKMTASMCNGHCDEKGCKACQHSHHKEPVTREEVMHVELMNRLNRLIQSSRISDNMLDEILDDIGRLFL